MRKVLTGFAIVSTQNEVLGIGQQKCEAWNDCQQKHYPNKQVRDLPTLSGNRSVEAKITIEFEKQSGMPNA